MTQKKNKSAFRETVEAVVVAFLIAMVIRTFVIQAFKIPSGSMIPTLQIGDHILVNKFLLGTPVDIPFTNITLFRMPGLRTPQKGDIVVFKYPEDPKRDFIKRVVGVGGDVVQEKDKVVYVNGRKIIEPYTQHVDSDEIPPDGECLYPAEPDPVPNPQSCRDNFGPLTVPKGTLFVMGDNRDQSYDSRFWRFVPLSEVKGKAIIIYWSWNSDKSWVRFSRIGKLVK